MIFRPINPWDHRFPAELETMNFFKIQLSYSELIQKNYETPLRDSWWYDWVFVALGKPFLGKLLLEWIVLLFSFFFTFFPYLSQLSIGTPLKKGGRVSVGSPYQLAFHFLSQQKIKRNKANFHRRKKEKKGTKWREIEVIYYYWIVNSTLSLYLSINLLWMQSTGSFLTDVTVFQSPSLG